MQESRFYLHVCFSALFDIVSFGEIVEVTPAVLLSLRILEFFLGETLHGADVFYYLPFSEFRDGNFRQINDKESLDHVPVLDVPFSLRDPV